jgi:hypothetical protein
MGDCWRSGAVPGAGSGAEGDRNRVGEARAVFRTDEDWDWFVDGLAPPVLRAFFHDWSWQCHDGQGESPGDWRLWLLMGGSATRWRERSG